MLTTHPRNAQGSAPHDDTRAPIWLDLLDPNEDERKRAAALLGCELPTRKQVGSIALSSRVRASEEMLRINIPGFVRSDGGQGAMTPLGILLTPTLLVTLRYADSIAFDRLTKDLARDTQPASSVEATSSWFSARSHCPSTQRS